MTDNAHSDCRICCVLLEHFVDFGLLQFSCFRSRPVRAQMIGRMSGALNSMQCLTISMPLEGLFHTFQNYSRILTTSRRFSGHCVPIFMLYYQSLSNSPSLMVSISFLLTIFSSFDFLPYCTSTTGCAKDLSSSFSLGGDGYSLVQVDDEFQ